MTVLEGLSIIIGIIILAQLVEQMKVLCFQQIAIEESFFSVKIVPDILDRGPKENLWVTYGTTVPVYPGIALTPDQTRDQPLWVHWLGKMGAHYTLAFLELNDATNFNPVHSSVLHWLQINIPGGHSKGHGDEEVKYFGPTLLNSTETKRYVFLVHEQLSGRLKNVIPIGHNGSVDWKKFIQDHKLSTAPVAGNFYFIKN